MKEERENIGNQMPRHFREEKQHHERVNNNNNINRTLDPSIHRLNDKIILSVYNLIYQCSDVVAKEFTIADPIPVPFYSIPQKWAFFLLPSEIVQNRNVSHGTCSRHVTYNTFVLQYRGTISLALTPPNYSIQ
jgi:hypothetical protein